MCNINFRCSHTKRFQKNCIRNKPEVLQRFRYSKRATRIKIKFHFVSRSRQLYNEFFKKYLVLTFTWGYFKQRRDKTTRQIGRKLVNAAGLYHKRFIFVHVTVNANISASYDWYLYVVNIFQKIVERWKLFNGNFCFSDRGRLQCWYANTTKLSSLCYLQVHSFKKIFIRV